MPATPAFPPHSTPRLFVDQPLAEGGEVHVGGPQAHYLLNVMRLREGAPVKLFDDRTGEYLATVASAGKRDLLLTIAARLREREAVPDLWLCQALIKKDRLDWIAEKGLRAWHCALSASADEPLRGRQGQRGPDARANDRGCRAMRTQRAS